MYYISSDNILWGDMMRDVNTLFKVIPILIRLLSSVVFFVSEYFPNINSEEDDASISAHARRYFETLL